MELVLQWFIYSYVVSIPGTLFVLRQAYGDEFEDLPQDTLYLLMFLPVLNQSLTLFFLFVYSVGFLLGLVGVATYYLGFWKK